MGEQGANQPNLSRRERVAQVVRDVQRRRAASEHVTDAEVVAAHPDLAPALESALAEIAPNPTDEAASSQAAPPNPDDEPESASKPSSAEDEATATGARHAATPRAARRRPYLMVIDPWYCDVIVQRYEQFTGKKAERVEGATASSRQPVVESAR